MVNDNNYSSFDYAVKTALLALSAVALSRTGKAMDNEGFRANSKPIDFGVGSVIAQIYADNEDKGTYSGSIDAAVMKEKGFGFDAGGNATRVTDMKSDAGRVYVGCNFGVSKNFKIGTRLNFTQVDLDDNFIKNYNNTNAQLWAKLVSKDGSGLYVSVNPSFAGSFKYPRGETSDHRQHEAELSSRLNLAKGIFIGVDAKGAISDFKELGDLQTGSLIPYLGYQGKRWAIEGFGYLDQTRGYDEKVSNAGGFGVEGHFDVSKNLRAGAFYEQNTYGENRHSAGGMLQYRWMPGSGGHRNRK